ncbi:hypothetical protein IWX87_003276 [Polaromonas sp. CG_9.7]|nr:hypothetical protein [Polaromonas sp. CG_9.7]MBG6115452.1 hypothetical protein [Polaromonas sp. CG_9.2]MDH6183262.1 hypothetical protein [Polaromonas sp. CG_23.6]
MNRLVVHNPTTGVFAAPPLPAIPRHSLPLPCLSLRT